MKSIPQVLYMIFDLQRSEAATALMERLYKLNKSTIDATLYVRRMEGEYVKKLANGIHLTHDLYKRYDEAAVFCSASDFAFIYFCATNIQASRKNLYLFFDEINSTHTPYNCVPLQNILSSFDRIFTQSRSIKAAVLRLCPTLGGRVFILPSTIEEERIARLASRPTIYEKKQTPTLRMLDCTLPEICSAASRRKRNAAHSDFASDGFDGLRLLMSGSSNLAGNQITALQAAWILNKRGFHFRLYLLNSSMYIDLLIRIMGLQNHIFSLGSPRNPYPYIKCCDVFICTEHAIERQSGLHPSTTNLLCPKDIDADLEGAIRLGAPIVALDTPLLHRRLEWEEDVLLSEDDPLALADAIEYICEDL